jgi:predicted ATP-grasp superfamily ATP-dependent carboligase
MSQQILILECYQHTLVVLRSLSRAGYQVTLGVTEQEISEGFVHVSRHVSSTWMHPDIIDDPTGFDSALIDFLEQNPQVKLIYPVGENSVRKLATIRAELPSGVAVTMPGNNVVESCLSKSTAGRIAERCHIPAPATRNVNSLRELRKTIRALGLPAIVKPADSRSTLLGKKCVFVRSESDLEALEKNWPEHGQNCVAQNEITGLRHNCEFVARNGHIVQYFESEVLRTDELDYSGNSVFHRSIAPNPLHREYCERYVAELSYTGIGLFQFFCDAQSGRSYFLEANPRTGAGITLAVHCGVDLPAAAVAVHLGDRIDPESSYPVNRSVSWLNGDLSGFRRAVLRKELRAGQSVRWLARMLYDFVRSDCHTTFTWEDPKPTLFLYRGLFRRSFFGSRRES